MTESLVADAPTGGPPCGTRARYTRGCHCKLCKRANMVYQQRRVRGPPRKVDAAPVRAHLLALREAGIGLSPVASAAGVNVCLLKKVMGGKATILRIKADVILAVCAAPKLPYSLVDAMLTRQLVDELLDEGMTKRELALRLGSRSRNPQLQIGKGRKRVRVQIETNVRLLHREVMSNRETYRDSLSIDDFATARPGSAA